MTSCRHCHGDLVPCPAPSMIPVCKGWKHAEFLGSMPIGAHYCFGRSVNPAAEPEPGIAASDGDSAGIAANTAALARLQLTSAGSSAPW